jgi:hypothetical protein
MGGMPRMGGMGPGGPQGGMPRMGGMMGGGEDPPDSRRHIFIEQFYSCSCHAWFSP